MKKEKKILVSLEFVRVLTLSNYSKYCKCLILFKKLKNCYIFYLNYNKIINVFQSKLNDLMVHIQ